MQLLTVTDNSASQYVI